MKKASKITILILGVAPGLWLFASFFVASVGKSMLAREIGKKLGARAEVGGLKLVFPSTIVAENLRVGESVKVARLALSPSILGSLSGAVVLNSLIVEQPVVRVTRKSGGAVDFGFTPPQGGKPLKLFMGRLIIRDAGFVFVDESLAGQTPFSVSLVHWNTDVSRVSLFEPLRMRIKTSGEFLGASGERVGAVEIFGWADPLARGMDADARLSGVLLAYFAPYVRKFAGRGVISGGLNLSAKAVSAKNDMTVDCHVEFSDVAFGKADEASAAPAEAAVMLGRFLAGGRGRVALDFSFRTKMDAPKFENLKVRGSVVEAAAKDILSRPPEETMEKFKEMGEQFEEIGREFKKIFKPKNK